MARKRTGGTVGSKGGKQPRGSSPAVPAGTRPPLPGGWSKRDTIVLAVLVGTALVLRVLHFLAIRSDPFVVAPTLDSGNYNYWGWRLATGQGWDMGVFVVNPIYPVILSLIYRLVGQNVLVPRMIQFALGLASALLVFRLTRRLYGQAAGFIALGIALFSGTLILFEGELLAETWVVFFLLCSFNLFLFRRNPLQVFLAGVFLGLAVIGRPNLLLFLPVPPLLLLLQQRADRGGWPATVREALGWAVPPLLLLGGVFLPIAPVTVHNIQRGDQVLITSHGGVHLFIGNNPEANAWYHLPQGSELESGQMAQVESSTRVAEEALGRKLKPSEVSDYWAGKAWAFIRANPAAAVRQLLAKILFFWNSFEKADVPNYYYTQEISAVFKWFTIPFGILVPFAVLGVIRLATDPAREWRRTANLFLLLFIVLYCLSVAVFYITMRYRVPVLVALIPLSALGVRDFITTIRRPGWRTLGGIGCAVLVAVGVVYAGIPPGLPNADLAHHYFSLGKKLYEQKEYPEALAAFHRAVWLNKDDEVTLDSLGLALLKVGQAEQAVECLQRAVALYPTYKKAWLNLGNALSEVGRFPEAERAYRKALEIDPRYALACNNLGNLYLRQGRRDDAVASYEKALAIDPGYRYSLERLADIQRREGRPDREAEYIGRLAESDGATAEDVRRYADYLRSRGQTAESLRLYRKYLQLETDARKREAVRQLLPEMEQSAPGR